VSGMIGSDSPRSELLDELKTRLKGAREKWKEYKDKEDKDVVNTDPRDRAVLHLWRTSLECTEMIIVGAELEYLYAMMPLIRTVHECLLLMMWVVKDTDNAKQFEAASGRSATIDVLQQVRDRNRPPLVDSIGNDITNDVRRLVDESPNTIPNPSSLAGKVGLSRQHNDVYGGLSRFSHARDYGRNRVATPNDNWISALVHGSRSYVTNLRLVGEYWLERRKEAPSSVIQNQFDNDGLDNGKRVFVVRHVVTPATCFFGADGRALVRFG